MVPITMQKYIIFLSEPSKCAIKKEKSDSHEWDFKFYE